MEEIVIRYSGPSAQPPLSLNAGGGHCQTSIKAKDGKEEIIFTGSKFSREDFEKAGGAEKEERLGLKPTP